MGIRLSRPTTPQIELLAQQSAAEDLTYSPVGVTRSDDRIPGYRYDRWTRHLGQGREVFDRGADALRNWEMHEAAGLTVGNPSPPSVGNVVAMVAPLPVGFIEVACRIVGVVDDHDQFGFTYGTLPRHPEQGEESFGVTCSSDGRVEFEIVAVSRGRHPLARAFPLLARRLQKHAITRYLDAMQSLASG